MTRRGFTLVEVLVALAIVAVTLAAGVRASGALTLNAQRLTDVTLAQWCAENQLVHQRMSGQFPDTGDSEFSCKQLGHEYAGTLSVRPTPNPNFRRMDVRMRDADGQPVLTLSTILGKLSD